jgi:predicted transcriptional regulator
MKKTEYIQIRIEPELKEEVQILARKKFQSISELGRQLFLKEIKLKSEAKNAIDV